MKKLLVLVFTLFSALASAGPFEVDDPFNQQTRFLPEDQAFQFNYHQENELLTLSWFITPEHYLYQDQLTINGERFELYTELPAGIDYQDEYFGRVVIYRNEIEVVLSIPREMLTQPQLTVGYRGCADAGLCYPPIERTITIKPINAAAPQTANIDRLASNQVPQVSFISESPLPLALALAFGLGLLLTFTPCVLPMLPIITASVAGAAGETSSRRRLFTLSLSYVQGMAITYASLGIAVASLGGQLQGVLQHPVAIAMTGMVFIFLALAMFGFFNLRIPASVELKLHEFSQKFSGGRHWPVFVIGAVSALIVSPCVTAPLTAILLFISETGDKITGAALLYALSLGMGVPLILVGTFSRSFMPKAGPWMNLVKLSIGILLVGFSLVFFERLLNASYSSLIWPGFALFAAAAFTIGACKFTRKRMAIGLSLIVIVGAAIYADSKLEQKPGAEFNHVKSISEIETAISEAKDSNRPVMLDLYADWCVACKDFENRTFVDDSVKSKLDNYVLLQIDLTDSTTPTAKAVYERFEVTGLPTILFFKQENGVDVEARISGFMTAEEFTAYLEAFLSNAK